jgi:acyl carrier protein
MNVESSLKAVMSVVLGIPADTIGDDTSMDTVNSWDSLKHMNLVLAIEDEFDVSIPDEDAAHITSYPLIKIVLSEQMKNR